MKSCFPPPDESPRFSLLSLCFWSPRPPEGIICPSLAAEHSTTFTGFSLTSDHSAVCCWYLCQVSKQLLETEPKTGNVLQTQQLKKAKMLCFLSSDCVFLTDGAISWSLLFCIMFFLVALKAEERSCNRDLAGLRTLSLKRSADVRDSAFCSCCCLVETESLFLDGLRAATVLSERSAKLLFY